MMKFAVPLLLFLIALCTPAALAAGVQRVAVVVDTQSDARIRGFLRRAIHRFEGTGDAMIQLVEMKQTPTTTLTWTSLRTQKSLIERAIDMIEVKAPGGSSCAPWKRGFIQSMANAPPPPTILVLITTRPPCESRTEIAQVTNLFSVAMGVQLYGVGVGPNPIHFPRPQFTRVWHFPSFASSLRDDAKENHFLLAPRNATEPPPPPLNGGEIAAIVIISVILAIILVACLWATCAYSKNAAVYHREQVVYVERKG